MSATLTRSDLAARVPAAHVDAAVDVMDGAPALELIAEHAEGWPLPTRLHPAAGSLVRAGILRSPQPDRWRVADSREVIL